ncbi:8501_t:CDS:1 [Cetraspora pellucida]|uniref:8501_t:CDS:1 n=1 Tax=Cetraspora pellucida TaxID=1433469 RepID=A0A9N9P6W4_9GLOM|nr:8501_t:CDS:1 [Cetraspora pellucida]
MPPRQHYELGKIPEHDDYSYDDDSVSGSSNFNQKHKTSNIEDDESDDDMRSDKSSDENVQSDESDQENEINEMDNTCLKEPDNKNTKDAVNDPIREIFKYVFVNDSWTCDSSIEKLYYSASIYPNVCYLCGSLDVNQPVPQDTRRTPRSNEK